MDAIIQIQPMLRLNVDGAREFAGKSLYSNTTNVKVKPLLLSRCNSVFKIQIQPMLRLNLSTRFSSPFYVIIQIQPMLRLNPSKSKYTTSLR